MEVTRGQTVLLTGASGGLGTVITRKNLPAKLTLQHVDIRTPETQKGMAGHDVAVHAACVLL